MKKFVNLAAVLALSVGALSACGSDGADSQYCDDLKSAKENYGGLGSGDTGQLDDVFTTFHKLAKEAPAEVQEPWETMDSSVTTVEKTLADAGIKVSQLAEIQAGKLPEGLDQEKLVEVGAKLQALSDADFQKATKDIEAHAKKVCGVTLQ